MLSTVHQSVSWTKKRDKYLDLARELKKLWNMRVMVISVVIDMLGTVPKGLEREVGESKLRG